MPNYCENDLHLYGEVEDINRLLKFVKSKRSDFDFDKIIPYPEKFRIQDELFKKFEEDLEKNPNTKPPEEIVKIGMFGGKPRPIDGFNCGGYEWCNDNWDTKWNACEPTIEKQPYTWSDNHVNISFSTAWNPPIKVIRKLVEKFPKLVITHYYFECGGEFHGRDCYEKGVLISSDKGKYYGNRGG